MVPLVPCPIFVLRHQKWLNIVLKGGDIGYICNKISDFVNNTVIIEDKFRKPLAYSIKAKSEYEKKSIEDLLQKVYAKNSDISVNYREVEIPIITELKFFGYIWVFETIKPLMSIDIIFSKNVNDDEEMIQRGKYYGIDFQKNIM